MSTLLYENVPLINSNTLENFAEGVLIGHHYGDLTRSRVQCISVNPNDWIVSAHPWREITHCFIGGKRTLEFEPRIVEDKDGVLRQHIYFNAPPSSDAFTVEVAGYGKVSADSGKLLENPDEIIQDLAALGGRSLSFPSFREACNRRGLRIGGSVYEARSIRSYITEILDSCGAAWLGDDAAFLADDPGYATPIAFPSALTQLIEAKDVAGSLDLYYAWNHSNGNHGAHILLEAVGCQYNTLTAPVGEYSAKWLRLPRDAQTLAQEILKKRAGRYISVQATVPGKIKTGAVVSLGTGAFDGPMRVLTSQSTEVESQITGEISVEPFANLRVKRFTQELPPTRLERVDVLILDGDIIEVTIFDLQNRSMPNVYVTFDDSVTFLTDPRGLVTFRATKGAHTLSLAGDNIESSDPFPFYVP